MLESAKSKAEIRMATSRKNLKQALSEQVQKRENVAANMARLRNLRLAKEAKNDADAPAPGTEETPAGSKQPVRSLRGH